MTKSPTATAKSKNATWQHKNATKNFDYTIIAVRLRTVSWGKDSHPPGVIKPFSTSQTFRSWVVIFHHRQPMACLSLNLYDTPGLAPRMNVLFWGPGDFPVSYSNRDTLWNAWNRHSGSFMVDTGILLSNME